MSDQEQKLETLRAQLRRLKWETIALGIAFIPVVLIGGIGFGFYLIGLFGVIGLVLGIFIISGYFSLTLVTLELYEEFRSKLMKGDFARLPTRRTRLLYVVAVWVLFGVILTIIVFSKLRS